MILNTTHTSKENKELINDLVGKPYSFMQSIKLKGIGSKRMVIEDASPNFKQYLNTVSDINYANLELRSSGILIHITKGLQNFTWTIPFYQLVIYKTNGSSIHAQGRFIHFQNNKMLKENKLFFDKVLNEKIKFDEQYNFQS
ncbi:hypothetical protein [Lacinutrix jangbogonensis]|uniref:hypothetical protein n=1 Tax=Lacinutrix jangbogonensis TaxID=1469557 RepID=UPI00053D60CA|nr:hypothetical protein [Lacinutrix jangbogonensis]